MPGPLSNIKVVELGTLIAGPYCARLLAEFGAEVIKIETPGEGDPLRKWRKLHEGNSLWWYAQARNKKSVAVNLRDPDGQAIVRGLAKGADIVVENFRPGTMEKWGLGYEALSEGQPRPHHGAHLGLRPDRPLQGPPRLRRHRRIDGRHALHHGLSRPRAGARRHLHRRLARGDVRRDRRAHARSTTAPRPARARSSTSRSTRPCSP